MMSLVKVYIKWGIRKKKAVKLMQARNQRQVANGSSCEGQNTKKITEQAYWDALAILSCNMAVKTTSSCATPPASTMKDVTHVSENLEHGSHPNNPVSLPLPFQASR